MRNGSERNSNTHEQTHLPRLRRAEESNGLSVPEMLVQKTSR